VTAKRLTIPACQRVLTVAAASVALVPRDGVPGGRVRALEVSHRLCGGPAVAVYRYEDGRELFVCRPCDADLVREAMPGPDWRLRSRRTA
jgi:hypothetical protein